MKRKPVLEKVLEASIQSDVLEDFSHVRVSIDGALAKRIKHLATMARREDVAFIHVWDYTCEYLKEDYDEEGKFDEVDVSTDTNRLVVSNDDFWWEGNFKNCDVSFSTDHINLEELQAATMPVRELPKHVDRVWMTESARDTYLKRFTK